MAYNKIVYGTKTLIDLTGDTVSESTVLSGQTFHDKSGASLTGTCTYDSDTSDDTAAVAEILNTKTAHARGALLTGTMPNIGKQTGTISTKTGTVSISKGYHDGSGSVSLDSTAVTNLVAENIRNGTEILGITGTMEEGSDENPQASKSVTPTSAEQTIQPDDGYTCLKKVVVAAVPYSEQSNSAGGTTVTIL